MGFPLRNEHGLSLHLIAAQVDACGQRARLAGPELKSSEALREFDDMAIDNAVHEMGLDEQ
ncbi:hypothetical protein [Bradyrhizobium australiense]|uniref:Uncharacterized protein n=1 Tax=Bradyrhizobium australiense TaxID=2721161 RepID=A0A7Y4GZ17_9BRAD|nr:hypothetical protein [Bradyrhizobium australiense]NOJ44615.1 hypothetical protein [Bradyrhizobium australiense]